MLFEKTQITGLFGFENRKMIFEGVDSRFKFVALTWAKGRATTKFPATFMRHDVGELAAFPSRDSLEIGVDLVRKLSPDSLSVMEFKSEQDVEIAQKLLKFPLLGEKLEGTWNLKLNNEFHMTNDSFLFQTSDGPGLLPLYEGKMFHQFTHQLATPRYWIEEKAGRGELKGGATDKTLDYQDYRFAMRRIGRNTDIRAVISTILPPNSFASESSHLSTARQIPLPELLALTAIMNSFVLDWFMRTKIAANISQFYVYQTPVPRLTSGDAEFDAIVSASARLICTTAEFDALAREAGLSGHAQGAATPDERAALRAQLDARIARLYGLNETEFAHILATFPLVDAGVKDAALAAFAALSSTP